MGELLTQNLKVTDGKLVNVKISDKAVIGDPAFDLAIAWTIFDEKARKIFFLRQPKQMRQRLIEQECSPSDRLSEIINHKILMN